MPIKNCFEYMLAKRKFERKEGELNPILTGRRPFEIIHMDHVGYFITTRRQNKCILGIMGNFTKYACVFAVHDVTQKEIIKRIEEFIEKFGTPDRIISNRGTCFSAKGFQELCIKYVIKRSLNSTDTHKLTG